MGEASLPIRSANPHAPPVRVSPHITLQPPLSRRGVGPGLILVLDHYAQIEKNPERLDPPPLQKWAEEGFAVVQVLVPGKLEEDGGEFPLKKALEALKGCEGFDGGGVALISYLTRIPLYVEEGACMHPEVKAIVSYGGKKFSTLNTSRGTIPPQLLHIAGAPLPRRESFSVVPESELSSTSGGEGVIKTFRYLEAKREVSWVLPSDEEYHSRSAALAHTRSLKFLKDALGGPWFDLEAVWEEHCLYEFGERNVEKTMATMVDGPYVNHIPTLTGGIGKERLTAFYSDHFVFVNPEDTQLELVSRTVGVDRLIDEFVGKLTHDRVVDWLLPGVPPTNKYLEIPCTSVIAFRGDRLCHEHISWDSGTVYHQLGLIPEWAKFPYPIDGKEAGEGKTFEIKLPTMGVETVRKLVEEGSVPSNALIDRGVEWREVDNK